MTPSRSTFPLPATRFPVSGSPAPAARSRTPPSVSARPRQVAYPAGRALEILGHAIEYLADEYALECRSALARQDSPSPQVLAIELLKDRSRTVYLDCALVPTFMERMRSWLAFASLPRLQPSPKHRDVSLGLHECSTGSPK